MTFRLPFYLSFSHAARAVSGMALIAAVAMLSACASTPAERTATLLDAGAALALSAVRYGSAPPLVGMLRTQKTSIASDELWVVIEGDGHAWLNMHQPSSDPTPRDAVGWRL